MIDLISAASLSRASHAPTGDCIFPVGASGRHSDLPAMTPVEAQQILQADTAPTDINHRHNGLDIHHIHKPRRGAFVDAQVGEVEQVAVGQL